MGTSTPSTPESVENRATPLFMWVRDGDDFVLNGFNPAAVEWTEGGVSSLRGARASTAFEDVPILLEHLEVCCRTGIPQTHEIPYRLRSSGRECRIAALLVRAAPDTVIIHVADITDHRTSEEVLASNLQHAEMRFHLLLEAAPDAVVIANSDGRIVLANAAMEQMFGYTRVELLGQPVEMLIPESTRGAHARERDRYMKAPRPRLMGSGREFEGRRKDGTPIAVEIALSSMGSEGQQLVMASVRNVEERRRAERIARENERQFRVLFESNPVPMWVFDIQTLRFLAVNAAALEAYGYSEEEFLGLLTLPAIRAPEEVPKLMAHPPSAQHDEEYRVRTRHRRRDGSEFDVDVISNVIDFQGRSARLSLCIDVTASLDATRRLSAAVAEKDILLREVHHRVKNNLQVVSSMLSMDIRRFKDEDDKELARASQRRVRAMALVHERVSESRNLAKVDVEDYMRQLAGGLLSAHGLDPAAFRIDVRAKGIHLTLDTAVPIALIVNELVANALKHALCGRTSGVVSVSLEPATAVGYVILRVCDDGIGLPRQRDPFSAQGLGLQLVRSLVSQIGGTLSAYTGQGTTFEVLCPLPQGR